MRIFLAAVGLAMLGGACGGGGTLSGSGGGSISPSGGGGAAASGSTPFVGGGGSGLVGTGTAGVPGNACGAVGFMADVVPPEVMVVLDTSASMNDAFDRPCPAGCPGYSKWAAAVAAIDNAVMSRPSSAWGLKFVAGTRGACDTGGVAVPLGYGNNGRLPYVLATRSNGPGIDAPGNTPTRAAIDVAAAHLAARPPGPHHVIVLLTDGAPDCKLGSSDILASDAAGAVQAIEDARSWGFDTLVVGIGSMDPGVVATLDEMARAGGRGRPDSPAYVPTSTAAEIGDVLVALADREAGCTFFVPAPPTNDGLTSRFNIGVRLDDEEVPLDPVNGWTYTDETGQMIELHGAACGVARVGRLVTMYFRCTGLRAD